MAQINKQRTPDELSNLDFNYYIAFKIDLKETDKTKIETKIKMTLADTSGNIKMRRFIELKDDIIEVMCNDATFDGTKYVPNTGARKKEADAAKTFKLKEITHITEILCQTRVEILKSELLDLYKKANQPIVYFSVDEFFQALSYLNNLGIKIINNIDTSIPFRDFQNIDEYLKPLNKKDLYDYLGLDKNANNSDIQRISKDLDSQAQKSSDLKRRQTSSNLNPLIKKILLDDQKKRSTYNDYLILRKDVWDNFASLKSYGVKEMTIEDYRKYVQIVTSLLKVSIAEAEKMIGIGCKYYQLTIIGKTEGNTFEYCPFPDCGKLYIKGAKSCPHCGRSLEVLCWNCKQLTRITKEDRGCPNCGATNHSHDIFNNKCKQIDKLLSSQIIQIDELQTIFLDIKNIVPNYAQRKDSTIAKKVAEYENIINEKIKQEETIGAKYKEDIAKIQQNIIKRCYQTALGIAKSLLVKYSTYSIDNSRRLIADISLEIQKAQTQVTLANQYIAKNNITMAINAAAKAIDICDDYNDARQIMQKFPPKPISNLRITTNNKEIKIEWDDNEKQDFVSYTIIKKIGTKPTSFDDGSLVDKGLSVKFFEDTSVISATPYYYAVYAERYNVKSAIVSSINPIMIFSDAINMQQEIVPEGIKVKWDTPQNVKSIEVWKNVGAIAPLKAKEGIKVETSNIGFSDSKAIGDNAYLVICNYEVNGKIIQSKGVKGVFKPYEQIKPLNEYKIENISDNKYLFSYSKNNAGRIKLYYSNSNMSFPFDKTLKFLDFNKICKGLREIEFISNTSEGLQFNLNKGQIYYIYPIINTEQLFIISKPMLINTMIGIDKCTYVFVDDTVTVSGILHQQAQSIIAKVNNEKYIDTVDEDGEKFFYDVNEYRKQNKLDIKLKKNTINYITLFVQFKNDNFISYSLPIKLKPAIDYRDTVNVLFSLDYTVSAVKPFKVKICFESFAPIKMPELLLMQGSPKPMYKNAGELCARIDSLNLKKGLLSKNYSGKVVIEVPATSTNTKFALFLNEETNLVQLKEVKKL